ncbi:MAG: hypothetical protein IJL76_02090 [Bacilli bacterium]|nr:hypothetical protein [Bacilli bacterium]
MKKLRYFTLMLFVFLFIGVVDVKAEMAQTFNIGDFNVTINGVQVNLYVYNDDANASSITMFDNPITFEIPAADISAYFTGTNSTPKQLKVSNDQTLDLTLVEIANSFDDESLSDFLEAQTFDKTKKYYGDIELKYTVNSFPSNYKSFTQINGYRTVIAEFPKLFAQAFTGDDEIDTGINLAKPAYETKALTAGTAFSTVQMLNLFTYNDIDPEDVGAPIDKIDITTDLTQDNIDDGISGLNYGLFSESENFDINTVNTGDKAIMFSIISGMGNYIDQIDMSTLGDDYVGDFGDVDDEVIDVVKVGNTAANQSLILALVGMISILSGLLIFGRMLKRYN